MSRCPLLPFARAKLFMPLSSSRGWLLYAHIIAHGANPLNVAHGESVYYSFIYTILETRHLRTALQIEKGRLRRDVDRLKVSQKKAMRR